MSLDLRLAPSPHLPCYQSRVLYYCCNIERRSGTPYHQTLANTPFKQKGIESVLRSLVLPHTCPQPGPCLPHGETLITRQASNLHSFFQSSFIRY